MSLNKNKIVKRLDTHVDLQPLVAAFKIYCSKYLRTNLSRSSASGNLNSTISSRRSLIAQSNWSGWLLAKTNINLEKNVSSLLVT